MFDDLQQIAGAEIPKPIPTNFPIDFEASVSTTDVLNETGRIATIIANLYVTAKNSIATVGQFIRSGGAPWAKSKLTLIDFVRNMSTNGTFSMKAYTDAPVGTLLKFKIESNVAGFADERNTLTTVSGEWAAYTWNFKNQDGPIYNVLSLMLGYATPNDASANATFLFDDIQQIANTLSNGKDLKLRLEGITSYPNPANDFLTISSENKIITSIILFDILGNQVKALIPNSPKETDVTNFSRRVYIAKISTL